MIQFKRPDARSRFVPGDIVAHRNYRYRGVVVDLDLTCEASDEWYYGNRTQPRKDQPWYHVLVDGATHTTYVAEENLIPDLDGSPVGHPLIPVYFAGFENGRYVRNDRAWEGA